MIKDQKRKRGRPPKPEEQHQKFKSISVPVELYDELDMQAKMLGVSVGKLASNRIRNGHYVESDVHQDREVATKDDPVSAEGEADHGFGDF